MKTFVSSHPLRFVLLIMALLEAVVLLLVLGIWLFMPDVSITAVDLPFMLLNAIIAAVLLSWLGWWRDAGFNSPSQWRHLLLLVFPIMVLLLPALVVGIQMPPTAQLIPMAVVMLLIGFQEEAIFRGIFIQVLLPRGKMQAVMWSATLFAVIHVNSILVGRDALFVLSQVIASFLGGFALAALRLRMNTIWPLVGLHALNDFIQFAAIGSIDAQNVAVHIPLLKVGIALIMFVYGLYLLREDWLPETRQAQHSAG